MIKADQQGAAEGPVQDGDLDDPFLHRRPDLRGGGARHGDRGAPLHGYGSRMGGVRLDQLAREALDRRARAYPAAESQLLPRAGSTPGAGTASSTARTPRPWQPPPARRAATNGTRWGLRPLQPATSTRRPCGKSALRGLLRYADDLEPITPRRGRDRQGDRQAVQVRRDVAGRAVSRGPPDPPQGRMNRLGGKSNAGEGGWDRLALLREAALP